MARDTVTLTVEEAKALQAALEDYMRADYGTDPPPGKSYVDYKRRWNAADKALVPLRGGPMSVENRKTKTEPPKEAPSWQFGR